jgi:hypothetical protein
VFERPQAEASSLKDLVDFAIDNDTGVVEDPETGVYYAVTGDLLYTYRPPAPTGGAHDGEAGTEPAADGDMGGTGDGREPEPSPDTDPGADADRPDGADSTTDAGSAE